MADLLNVLIRQIDLKEQQLKETQERHKIKLFQFQKLVQEKDFIIQGLFERRTHHNQEEVQESKKVLALLHSSQQNKDLESLKAIQRHQKLENRQPRVTVFQSYLEKVQNRVNAIKQELLEPI